MDKLPLEIRSDINQLVVELGLQTGWRQHFAKALSCHPSSINNAMNGCRNGPRENELLSMLYEYLMGLYKYYQRCAPVNTKMQ